VPGGGRDPGDDDDVAELRARAEAAERRLVARTQKMGQLWQGEGGEDPWRGDRVRQRRKCALARSMRDHKGDSAS